MVLWPTVTVLANPVALIVAIAVVDDVQVTEFDTSWVLPSVQVAVATNCWVPPAKMVGLVGVTVRDTTWAAETSKFVLADCPAKAAVIRLERDRRRLPDRKS